MKFLSFLLLICCACSLSAQTTTITVEGANCKAINVYAFNGVGFEAVATLSKAADGTFTGQLPAPAPSMRYVGAKPGDALPVIIGEPTLLIKGTCGRMQKATTERSPLNEEYQRVKEGFQANNRTAQAAQRGYNTARSERDSAQIEVYRKQLAESDEAKKKFLEETRAASPVMGRIVALNTFLSWVNNDKRAAPNELDYFVNHYFKFVDHQDEGYNDLPWTYEANRTFATVLAQAIPNDQLGPILKAVYNRWPAGSRAQLLAMTGGFAALMQRKHPSSIQLADAIQENFKEGFPAVAAQIEAQAAGLRTFQPGAEAPLFAGPNPEGEEISLESLRGKIVLIDFWASWCGPCRRENPNVVKLYNEYKEQGFEILGVSLDRTKDRWVQAIAADKLTWLHISDLKGWKSKYAQQYGVSSIPQTVLLDREGKIIARNLRGAQLAQRLKQVFAGK